MTGLFITFERHGNTNQKECVSALRTPVPIQKDRVSNKGGFDYIHPSSLMGLKTLTGLFITFERHGNTNQKECVS